MLKAALIVVTIAAALLVIVNSQVMVIQHISVVGNRTLLAEEIIELSQIKIGDRYKDKSDAQIEANLERNHYIEFERCEFDYNSRRLTLYINERLGWAVIRAYGLYYVIDETGVVLESSGSAYPQNVSGPMVAGLIENENTNVWLTVGTQVPVQQKNRLEAMEATLKALDATNMLMRMATLDVSNPKDVWLMTDEGTKIELGDTSELEIKLLIAQEVLYQRESKGDLMGARLDVTSVERAHFIPAILPTKTPSTTATPVPGATSTPR